MSYLKRFGGEHARQRFLNEAAAYQESDLFWTSWLPGWAHPRCLSVSIHECVIRESKIRGRQLSWGDGLTLTRKLAATLPLSQGTVGPRLSRRVKSRAWKGLVEITPGPVVKHIAEWARLRRPNLYRIQGDLRPDQVVVNEQEYVLLDWELSRYGMVGEDIGSLLAHGLLAKARGEQINLQDMLTLLSPVIPEEVCAALAAADLLRQATREQLIGDTARAEIRASVADDWIRQWFKNV